MDIPEVPRLPESIGSVVPGAAVPNPLDATGFMNPRPAVIGSIMKTYLIAPEFGTSISLSQFAYWDVTGCKGAESSAQRTQAAGRGPALIAPLAGDGGWWLEDLRTVYGVAIGTGLRSCLRGLNAAAAFIRSRRDAAIRDPACTPALPRPAVTPPLYRVRLG